MKTAWLLAVFYNSSLSSFSFSTFFYEFLKIFILYALRNWYKNFLLRFMLNYVLIITLVFILFADSTSVALKIRAIEGYIKLSKQFWLTRSTHTFSHWFGKAKSIRSNKQRIYNIRQIMKLLIKMSNPSTWQNIAAPRKRKDTMFSI